MKEPRYYIYENDFLIAEFMNTEDIGYFIDGYLRGHGGFDLTIRDEMAKERFEKGYLESEKK